MKKALIVILLLFGFIPGTAALAQPPGIVNGSNYLLSTQSSDGSWSGSAITEKLPATVTVMETLQAIGQKETPAFARAVTWLSGQSLKTTDYLAERLQALASGDSDNITLLASLNRINYAWGGYNGYGVNTLDTAQALQALKAANFTDRSLLNSILTGPGSSARPGIIDLTSINDLAAADANPDMNIIRTALYTLADIQNSDGGWGFRNGDASSVYSTAIVLQTMALYKNDFPLSIPINKGVNYLLAQPLNVSVYETALAFIALIESGQGQAQPLQYAVNYLTSSQAANGSWNDDPYSTALALRALSSVKPDLAITTTDIAVTPATPTAGDSITVTATIRNTGLEGANSVTVRLLDNGTVAGEQTIATIAANGTGQALFVISPLTPVGEHILTISVDPLSSIDELSRANNTATSRIWAKAPADLVVLPAYLTFAPAYPKPAENITLSFRIANMGETTVSNVATDLYDGDPASGAVLLGSATVSTIPGGGLGSGAITFSLAASGNHNLYLIADPLHTVTETSTSNNIAEKSLTVNATAGSGFIDLTIPPAGISIAPSRPRSGDTVTISLLAVNYGNEAATADLELFNGSPTGGLLLLKTTLTLNAGESHTVTIPWQIPSGIHTLQAGSVRLGALKCRFSGYFV